MKFTIPTLAKALGVSTGLILIWEKQGYLPPPMIGKYRKRTWTAAAIKRFCAEKNIISLAGLM